jgi:hypothetical protein
MSKRSSLTSVSVTPIHGYDSSLRRVHSSHNNTPFTNVNGSARGLAGAAAMDSEGCRSKHADGPTRVQAPSTQRGRTHEWNMMVALRCASTDSPS